MTEQPIGTFCLVLHSHLPWLPHHGTWPVGEEWLYQAWANSYLPVVDLLRRFAEEGRRDVLTLGLTPILAAQLDDPYCLRACHEWLGDWRLRADYAATRWNGRWRPSQELRDLAAAEHRAADAAIEDFETHWRHGFSPVLRPLRESGVFELLGGPATHPFQPLLTDRVRGFALRTGLADTKLRLGARPAASGRRNAATRPAWRPTTRRRASRTSWSTAPRCTGKPVRPRARSAIRTWCVSAAIWRSPTGSGRRRPVIRVRPNTATSTPTTTPPA